MQKITNGHGRSRKLWPNVRYADTLVGVQVLDWKADLCTKKPYTFVFSEADFDEMIPLIEKELEEVKNKKKQNKKPKNDETNNEEMEA